MTELSFSTLVSSLMFALSVYVLPLLLRSNTIKNELSASEKYKYLDSLRGIVASMVFIHHSRMVFNYHNSGSFTPAGVFTYQNDIIRSSYSHFGQSAVMIFFMITGFLFYEKLLHSKGKIEVYSFYIKRVKRILPAMLSCFALAIIINTLITKSLPVLDIKVIISWLSFGFFIPESLMKIPGWILVCGVFWTLAIEVKFYLMTPALSLFTTSIKSSFTWIAVLTFITISTWSCDLIDEKTATIFLCFISGALIASINLSFNAKFSSLIQSPIMAIAVLIALISSWVYSPSSYTFIVIPALALILLAVTNNNSFIGLLKIKPFKLAGKVSYSIYILHGLCLNFVIGFLFTKSTYEFTFAASAFFVMMLSTLNYFYVEKRFMGKMKDTEHPIYVK